MTFSPRLQFQSNVERRRAWAEIAVNPVTHSAITHSLAEMSTTGGLGPEELRGARLFAMFLLNLSEEVQEAAQIPVKSLKSWDMNTLTAKPAEPQK